MHMCVHEEIFGTFNCWENVVKSGEVSSGNVKKLTKKVAETSYSSKLQIKTQIEIIVNIYESVWKSN